LMVFWEKS